MAAEKKSYIDAVRGWAILLVMTCHVGGMFPGMPYPVKKLTNFGAQGVQMFFLASAVTLLMSWHAKRESGKKGDWCAFFLRRFLRIAPMYYTGALIYFVAEPPDTGFDVLQMLRSFAFVNVWRPEWVPTTQTGWLVVPGGWSIGVEFTFYSLFPILAALVISLPRALCFVAIAWPLAIAANCAGLAWLQGYDPAATFHFLYFWFPNQLPVFALGFVLYFLVQESRFRIRSRMGAYCLLALPALICIVAAEHPHGSGLFDGFATVPNILIATISFMAFILVLACGPETLFTHPWICRLGVLSFSCYVLHFLIIHMIGNLLGTRLVTGYSAMGMGAVLWVLAVTGTAITALATHRVIEQPGITLARRLLSSRRHPASRSVPTERGVVP